MEMTQDETKPAPVDLFTSASLLDFKTKSFTTPPRFHLKIFLKILTPVLSHYSGNCGTYGCYSQRSGGKTFVPLPKEDYLLFYKQLNYVPKGNVNSRVTVTNYHGYDTTNDRPINPVDETHDRTLPNAAAAYSPQSTTLSFVNPSQQKPLDNTDICNSKVNLQASETNSKQKLGYLCQRFD